MALIGLFGSLLRSQAQTISQSGTSLDVNLTGGLSNWQVDGVDELNQQWFYYRVGSSGPEASIDSINTASGVSSTASRVIATYANSVISVKTTYSLSPRTAGSSPAVLSESITVKNTSNTTQDFHFFEYSDFDLGGASGNQTVQFYNNGSPAYYEVKQTDGTTTLDEIVNSANLGAVQAGIYDGNLLGLTDATATTFNNTLSAGTGNVVFGYEWDATLAAGGSFLLSKTLTVAPEPSVLTILGLGMVGMVRWGYMRRRAQTT